MDCPTQRALWPVRVVCMLALACAGCASTPPLPPLLGSAWALDELGNARAAASPAATLVFDRDTMATGSSGCNRYSVPADWAELELRFGQAMATRRGCAPALAAQEHQLFEALEETRSWKQDRRHLWLLDGQGRALARFSRTSAADRPDRR